MVLNSGKKEKTQTISSYFINCRNYNNLYYLC